MRPLYAIPISFLPVFAVLGIATLLGKKGVDNEITRKITHILLSNWIIAAMLLFEETWAVCVAPVCFVVLNYISYRKKLFAAIQRKENDTPGTVWFAVSLLLLCAVCWQGGFPWIAACGMLAMGYGDGLAALVGRRLHRRAMPVPFQSKSLAGSVTVAVFSALPVGILCGIYAPSIIWQGAFCCGMLAMFAELVSPRGIDNLTLPLIVSLTVWLLHRIPDAAAPIMGASLSLLVLLAAFILGGVTVSGMLAGVLLGTLLFTWGGALAFGALVAFFVAGSAASKLREEKKRAAAALHHRRGARSAAQVAANGVPPLLLVLCYGITGKEVFLLGVLACFAAATADTFSSEIGMLSARQPVSILTLQPVQRGLSGGITPLGFGSAALGALLIALCALPNFGWRGCVWVFVPGVAGSLLDSLLGALFQVKYRLPGGTLTEQPVLDGAPLPQASGISWINNDIVNALSIFVAGLLGTGLSYIALLP